MTRSTCRRSLRTVFTVAATALSLTGAFVAAVPLERFMLETDCPYLAPAPDRGKRCEPAHTRAVADRCTCAGDVTMATTNSKRCSHSLTPATS